MIKDNKKTLEKKNLKEYKKEQVCETTVEYDPKYMYYLDKQGNIYRSPRSVGPNRLRRREKVLDLKIDKKPNHLYYVNNKGEIWCVQMNRGGVVGSKRRSQKIADENIPTFFVIEDTDGKEHAIEIHEALGIKKK
ncbi:MAG: hypothetical protein LBD17_04550 [Endomicrobium sp.]|jgi:hypothetical protein|nr:hypothetical protein [Endomicrobium sp.]